MTHDPRISASLVGAQLIGSPAARWKSTGACRLNSQPSESSKCESESVKRPGAVIHQQLELWPLGVFWIGEFIRKKTLMIGCKSSK